MADPKDREKEAKLKELAEAIYVLGCVHFAIRTSPEESFLAAERFYEEAERRWEALK